MRLETHNICKSFDGKKILNNVSINVNDNEIVGLVGSSGSGKTTLFNIIAGIIEPDEGDVLLDGEVVTGKTGLTSYMLQKDMLLPYMTIIDNVSMPVVIKGMKTV